MIKLLGIASDEAEPAHIFQIGMLQHTFNQPPPEANTAILLENKDVGEIGKGRVIGDGAREADLSLAVIEAEGKRMTHGFFDELARRVKPDGVDVARRNAHGIAFDGTRAFRSAAVRRRSVARGDEDERDGRE